MVQEALDASDGDQASARIQMAAAHPINRLGQPSDIANVVLFLASSKAGFMTGEYINVDGGLMAKGAWA
jgi:NAD(P)-dependent dehydrogenase (short-subunit alcohol dehydrogenase family)